MLRSFWRQWRKNKSLDNFCVWLYWRFSLWRSCSSRCLTLVRRSILRSVIVSCDYWWVFFVVWTKSGGGPWASICIFPDSTYWFSRLFWGYCLASGGLITWTVFWRFILEALSGLNALLCFLLSDCWLTWCFDGVSLSIVVLEGLRRSYCTVL